MRFPRATTVVALMLLAACHRSGGSSAGGGTMAAAAPRAPATPAGVTPQLIAQGDSLFAARSCARCHGALGVGGRNGPSLAAGPWLHGGRDYANLLRIITSGVPKDSLKDPARTLAMNPRGGGAPPLLTDDQIKAVAAYVWSISAAKTK